MMMALARGNVRLQLSAAVPPEVYFRAAAGLLRVARGLFTVGLLGRSGLMISLNWSNGLSRAGMESWRARTRTRPRPRIRPTR
jgi:hypothetical protein